MRKFLILGNGLPGHNGCARLLRILGLAGFSRAFVAFADDPGAEGAGPPESHGKMLRRFFVRGKSPVCACLRDEPGQRMRKRRSGGPSPGPIACGCAPAGKGVCTG
ncbi:MAG: hypothetical protein IOC75_11095 [Rhodobacter sp.]|nr:hypothetical protein [Rhodobacter sp.]MCA3549841.1 hypothetical protein [Rhodobacter sp.]